MYLVTLTYSPISKWSVGRLPELDSPQTLVLVFAASNFINNPEPIQELARQYPNSHILGCSTSGEIFGAHIQDDSLSVAIIKFGATPLRSVSVPIATATNNETISESILSKLRDERLRGIFLLGSGLDINFARLIAELNKRVNSKVAITGGIAGDGDRFQRTWVIKDGMPVEGHLSAVGFYGDAVNIGFGSEGGWQLSGMPMLITRAEGNLLYELNGQSALRLYKLYLRDQAAKLPSSALLFPLAIKQWAHSKRYVVRTVLGIDEQTQSMTFAGDMPRNSFAQFMGAQPASLISGAANAAKMVKFGSNSSNEPLLSIAVSCVGRRLVLKDQTENELEAVLSVLPSSTKQIGFYSYGEICSRIKDGFSDLHNQTMTLTTISERG